MKVNITTDDTRLRSFLTTNKTFRFTKKSFFFSGLAITESYLGPLGDIEGFVELVPGTYRSDKPIKFTGIAEIHLNCDCAQGSIVNGVSEPVLYSFLLDKPPGLKVHHTAKIKHFRKIKNSVLSHITFYIEDDDNKLVDFNKESISSTCQLNEI